MAGEPWWMAQVDALQEKSATGLGPLWQRLGQLQFVRENVDAAELDADFVTFPRARGLWADFVAVELRVLEQLDGAGREEAESMRTGERSPSTFRSGWEGLGFIANAEGGGTPADDYLDAMFLLARYTEGEEKPPFGMPNMSSRAARVADFLAVTEPGLDDVVIDIGSGSGKVALTVAASADTTVLGVEYGQRYVEEARRTAEALGLQNVTFLHADVTAVDLSRGSIFYLYHPFYGAPAVAVAEALGTLARTKAITVYAAGPHNGFGEHFLRQVDNGALRLSDRRGEFNEVLVLRSAHA